MEHYDPYKAVDAEEWLALDEAERMDLVRAYHEQAGIELPNQRVHAAVHTMVETQIAMGDELPVRRKLAALMKQGLSRHEAVHAIACVLGDLIYHMMRGEQAPEQADERYYQDLSRLTAASWRAEFADPDAE